MKCPVDPEGIDSRFIQNVGDDLIVNGSKLRLFYFEILQSPYFSRRCGLGVDFAQL